MIRGNLYAHCGLTLDVLAALALISLNFPGAEAAQICFWAQEVLEAASGCGQRYCLGLLLCWPRGGQYPFGYLLLPVLLSVASPFLTWLSACFRLDGLAESSLP